MQLLRKLKILSFYLLLPAIAYSQSPRGKEIQQIFLTKAKVKSNIPKGFIISDSTESFVITRNVFLSQSNCKIISKKKDLIIYTTIIPFDTAGTAFIRSKLNKDYDRNNNYLKLINSKIDSTTSKLKYFQGDTLAKLGADVAGTYNMQLERTYAGIYKKAKVLFLRKKDVGEIELIYFYLNDQNIDKYIKRTLFSFVFE